MTTQEARWGEGRAEREQWSARFGRVLGVDPEDGSWRPLAACLGCNPDLFCPGRGDINTITQAAESPAVRTCRSCPVIVECLVAGAGEKIGVWGGVTAGARKRLRVGLADGRQPSRVFEREAPVAWAARQARRKEAA